MRSLLFIVVVIAALMAVADALDRPVVYIDALTRECVKAEGPQGPIPCGQLPNRYTRVMVGQVK